MWYKVTTLTSGIEVEDITERGAILTFISMVKSGELTEDDFKATESDEDN